MLKSYKQLSRWYGALEPEAAVPASPGQNADSGSGAGDDEASESGSLDEPHAQAVLSNDARPHGSDPRPLRRKRVRDEATDDLREDDAPAWQRPPQNIPVELPAHRSEFVGGWSDWVVGHAPGPDDDYPIRREADLVRFPWPDDDLTHDRAPGPLSSPTLRARAGSRALRDLVTRRARAVGVLIVAVLVLLVAAALAAWVLHDSAGVGGASSPNLPSTAAVRFTANSVQAGVNPSPGGGACPTERLDAVVRGAEAGGTDSGPDAVLAFQYAYYVHRSAAEAAQVLAPNAAVPQVAVIQRGIDSVPVGTKHCVRVARLAEGKYSVEVTEYRPGGAPATYSKQMVDTTVIDGRTLITGIRAG